jgi:hypothetical protein
VRRERAAVLERVGEQDRARHDRQRADQTAHARAIAAGRQRSTDDERRREQQLDREHDHAEIMTAAFAEWHVQL